MCGTVVGPCRYGILQSGKFVCVKAFELVSPKAVSTGSCRCGNCRLSRRDRTSNTKAALEHSGQNEVADKSRHWLSLLLRYNDKSRKKYLGVHVTFRGWVEKRRSCCGVGAQIIAVRDVFCCDVHVDEYAMFRGSCVAHQAISFRCQKFHSRQALVMPLFIEQNPCLDEEEVGSS